MIDHNSKTVFLSFLIIVFLTFYPCFRKVTSDSSEGATVMIILTIVFIIIIEHYSCLLFLPCCSCSGLVIGDNLEEAIVTVAGGNILDETWSILSKLYT
jgi:heme/copper-type cytochrome/quinol oxidase subunit 4